MRRTKLVGSLLAGSVLVAVVVALAQKPADPEAKTTSPSGSKAKPAASTGWVATPGAPAAGGGGMGGMMGSGMGAPGMMPGMPGGMSGGGVMMAPGGTMPGMGMPGMRSMGMPVDPEQAQLAEEIQKAAQEEAELLAKYTTVTDEEKRAKIKESLAKVVQTEFDLQQREREMELAPIEARVKKLRELIQKRKEARQVIVDRRLEQLLRDAEGLGWTPPGATVSDMLQGMPGGYPATRGGYGVGAGGGYGSSGYRTTVPKYEPPKTPKAPDNVPSTSKPKKAGATKY